MAFDFHADKQRYFQNQVKNSKDYIVPFVAAILNDRPQGRILEIGSAEGGVLKAFTDKGFNCTGVELVESRVVDAEVFMAEELASSKVRFVCRNIYDIDLQRDMGGAFDLIILKDVIEHIFDQEKLLGKLKEFLTPGGQIFFGFPPWYMPFGGHQQICKNKMLSLLPYYHLLPAFAYKALLQLFGEHEATVKELLEIKETGISIERFERIAKSQGYKVVAKTHFLINPIYELKFGLKPRKQFGLIKQIPFIRNFFTTCVYYSIAVR